jgi:hypothetical protein
LLTEPGYDYPPRIVASLQVGPWDTNLDPADGMTGHWSQLDTPLVGPTGTVHTENEIVTMTRVTTSALPASAIH